MQANFREILEEKLKSPLEEPYFDQPKSQYSDPFALSFLMGSIPQFRYQTNSYKAQSTSDRSTNKHSDLQDSPQSNQNLEPIIVEEEAKYSLQDLSAEAVAALFVLKGLGAEIKEQSFSFNELKKQYRRLLLRYHPDHNNQKTSESFFDLRQAYDSLTDELGDI